MRSNSITNAVGFLYSSNNSLRKNIFVPSTGTTYTEFTRNGAGNSITNYAMTWSKNTSNKCTYNSAYNIYIYNNL